MRTLKRSSACVTGVHAMDGSPETFERCANSRPPAPDGPSDFPCWRTRRPTLRRWRAAGAEGGAWATVAWGRREILHRRRHRHRYRLAGCTRRRGGGTEPFWPDPARYARAVHLFAKAGFQCVTHATGDRAVRAALDAYAPPAPQRGCAIASSTSRPSKTMTSAGLPPRASRLDAAAAHAVASRLTTRLEWAGRLGRERTSRAWRTRDLLDSGALLALGSDWPVAQYDPRIGMAWARLRRHPGSRTPRCSSPTRASPV